MKRGEDNEENESDYRFRMYCNAYAGMCIETEKSRERDEATD